MKLGVYSKMIYMILNRRKMCRTCFASVVLGVRSLLVKETKHGLINNCTRPRPVTKAAYWLAFARCHCMCTL